MECGDSCTVKIDRPKLKILTCVRRYDLELIDRKHIQSLKDDIIRQIKHEICKELEKDIHIDSYECCGQTLIRARIEVLKEQRFKKAKRDIEHDN